MLIIDKKAWIRPSHINSLTHSLFISKYTKHYLFVGIGSDQSSRPRNGRRICQVEAAAVWGRPTAEQQRRQWLSGFAPLIWRKTGYWCKVNSLTFLMAHYFLLETFLRILMEYLKNINQPICVWKNCLILFLDLFTSAMSTMVQLLRSWSSISTAAEASIASPSFVISLTELRKVSLTSSSLTRIQWRRRWLLTSLSLGADRSRYFVSTSLLQV